MPYEEKIPSVPTRAEELVAMDKLQKQWLNQNYITERFMHEDVKQPKMREYKNAKEYNRKFLATFGIGLFIGCIAIKPLKKFFMRSDSGLPFYYQPKYMENHYQHYNTYRDKKMYKVLYPVQFFIAFFYANTFTDKEKVLNEDIVGMKHFAADRMM